MSYLTAYRSQSERYGDNRGGKAFKLPRPYQPQTKPLGANDNAPRPANDNIRKARLALRLAGRFKALGRANPYLQLALTGYDLYRMARPEPVQSMSPFALNGFTMQHVCVPSPCTHGLNRDPPAVPWIGYLAGSGPFGVVTNADGTGVLANSFSPTSTVGNVARIIGWYPEVIAGTDRSTYSFYAYRNVTTNSTARWRLRNYYTPPPSFVLDPNLLPIKQVLNLPLPPPTEVVLNRVNDELGSQRNNGDTKPRFVVRRPPPPGQKEKKLRGLGPYVAAVSQAMHAVTEGLDALDAIHDALPARYKAKATFKNGKWYPPTPQAKGAALYANMEHIDWNEAVKNLIVNHYVDKLVGTVSGRAKQGLDKTPIGRIIGGRAVFVGAG